VWCRVHARATGYVKLSHASPDWAEIAACHNPKVSETRTERRPVTLAIILIVASIVGWWAAFQLTLEKLALLANPNVDVSCDFSVLVQCSANLTSWQGSLFGFPNPLLGLTGWMAPFVLGVALLLGSRLSRPMWVLVNLGMLVAFAFVVFLISQSIYELNTLCPWCMVTWSVTIPSFLAVTFHNMRDGVFGDNRVVRRIGSVGWNWLLVITLVCYLIVAVLAQTWLDVLGTLGL
jgi:uncharacterized membrane protein